jgi:ADP-heptose:LPS heptosyltransferase
MNTTFLLSGGAGRIVAAIPALEKFHRLNPHDDFKVLIYGWENLYWNHPLLQSRTYSIGQKGIFDLIVKNSNLVHPEPYHRYSYYNQKTSLAEAFDEEINQTNDHSDLNSPKLYCHSGETTTALKMIDEALTQRQKKKFIVYQPYGSGIQMVSNRPVDTSGRSLDVDDALSLGKLLSQDAVVLYFGPNEFIHPRDDFMLNAKNLSNVDLRFYMAMILQCDYFVGVDSVGQHMARAFDKPGLVIMGSTFEKNVTYPEHFKIYRNGVQPTYNPIRIGGVDCEFADRANDNIMKFTDRQIQEIYNLVRTIT